ncbi:alpha/beta hydrolase [Algoriphagus namhaensis]
MSEILYRGTPLKEAKKVAILIHGRGASTSSMLSLRDHLQLDDFALILPEATGNTWYPYSFMAPDAQNAKSLNTALELLRGLLEDLYAQGFEPDQIFLIGFSQGACLSLDFAARHAARFGGVIAFTGGLIGEKLRPEIYSGDFAGAPIFIGASKQDMHVPLHRIEESASLLSELGAEVKTLIFEDSAHTIRQEEVDWVNQNMLS